MNNKPNTGYTAAQMHQYYNRINLPSIYRHEPGPASKHMASQTKSGLELLSALQRYNLANIPFENLQLHYSSQHSMSINPTDIFNHQVLKANGKGGRGGYCMTNNALFSNILRSLGFNVMSTGARISSSVSSAKDTPLADVTFTGLSHMVNLVSFSDKPSLRYLVDVGFGGGGPTFPFPLVHDENGSVNMKPDQEARLIYAPIPAFSSSSSGQKLWIYEKRNSAHQNFSPCYCFGECEFFEADFAVLNHWTSTSRDSWFTRIPICVKMILSEHGDELVGSVLLLGAEYKKRVRGELLDSREMKSEEQRIKLLEDEFGIVLDEEEIKGIHGMVSAL
jgi:arylamine N-acetyltransferase